MPETDAVTKPMRANVAALRWAATVILPFLPLALTPSIMTIPGFIIAYCTDVMPLSNYQRFYMSHLALFASWALYGTIPAVWVAPRNKYDVAATVLLVFLVLSLWEGFWSIPYHERELRFPLHLHGTLGVCAVGLPTLLALRAVERKTRENQFPLRLLGISWRHWRRVITGIMMAVVVTGFSPMYVSFHTDRPSGSNSDGADWVVGHGFPLPYVYSERRDNQTIGTDNPSHCLIDVVFWTAAVTAGLYGVDAARRKLRGNRQ